MSEKILHIGIFLTVILATFVLAYLIDRFFKRAILQSSEEMNYDPTNQQFLRHAFRAIIYILGFSVAIYSIPELRTIANTMFAGAGVLAVAIGFASQQALGNIISGIFIIIFKPFRVNDRLKIKELSGIVEDITLRHTVIRDFENKRILIPNSVLSNEIIINSDFVDDKICKWIDIGISYDSDIDKAKEIIRAEIMNHPLHIDPRTAIQIENGDPIVNVRVILLGDFSITLRAWAWAKNSPDGFVLSCDLMESIKKEFDKEGIEIPFPYRTIVYKNDLL